MLTRITLRLIVVIVALGYAGVAFSQDRVHEYFNDTARKVQATENPIQKREILSKSLVDMTKVLDTVKNAPLTSEQDDAKLDRVKATLLEKSEELVGTNGFDRVPDDQLNAFSTYIVQDMEQADRTISIGLVTLLLIIIIIILVA
jgi:U3 small nucleolar ribonucleoprotein component